jgi:hypothetical protein
MSIIDRLILMYQSGQLKMSEWEFYDLMQDCFEYQEYLIKE